jgi:hypothetical protein
MCDAQGLKQTDIGLLIVNDQDAGVENVGQGKHHGRSVSDQVAISVLAIVCAN